MSGTARRLATAAILTVMATLAALPVPAQQPTVSAAQLRSLELQSLGSDAAYSPFGTYFAVITRTNRVRLYDANYDELWNYRGQGHHGTGPGVAFTADEQFLILPGYGSSSRVGIVRAATGEVVTTLDGHDDDVVALSLSPDNQWLVTVQYGGKTDVWKREGDGFILHQRIEREAITVLSLAFAPSSELFAIGNNQDYVELYALDSGASADGAFTSAGELRPNQYYGNTAYLFGLAFSPDGRWLAGGVRDEITIWTLDGSRLVSTDVISDIQEGYCYSLEFSPDGAFLFAGFQASRTGAWARDSSGEWVHQATFSDRQDYIWDLAISPDGSQLATVSVTENGIAIWDLTGVGAGPLITVARMLAEATGGEAPGEAHRSVLTNTLAREVITTLGDTVTEPRGMFEAASTYEARRQRASASALKAVQDAVLARYGGERTEGGAAIEAPLEQQGTYDIDAGRYSTKVLGVRAELAIPPREAEGLYLNWEDARVEARLPDADGAAQYSDYELVHPTTGRSYPILMSEDPMSGIRLRREVAVARPLELTAQLVIENLKLDPLFPALYRSYERHPIGSGILRNTGDSPVENLDVQATLATYSTEPANCESARAIAPGARAQVDLMLILGDDIVASGGEETLAVTIDAVYRMEGEEVAGDVSALVPILNRNAIRWDDDRKVGAFMTTVQSPTMMTMAGEAAARVADVTAAALPRPFLIAMQVFETLRSRGIAYRVDPASAYADLSQEEGAIDFLQFPAETLSYGAGDCDDLSVLYNSVLEAAGVRTAFITTPGHIFTAFAIDRPPEQIPGMFPESGEFVVTDDKVWVPVETTMLASGFREAWKAGARQWRAADAQASAGFFTTEDAWRVYPPAPWEPALPQGRLPARADAFRSELDAFINEAVSLMIDSRKVESPATAREHNVLGTIYARFGLLEQARAEFERAANMDEYVPAIINLASVSGLQGNHGAARELLDRANDLSPDNPRILLGLAVEHLEGGSRSDARDFFDRAASIDPDLAREYPLFGAGGSGDATGRASDSDAAGDFLWDAWAE